MSAEKKTITVDEKAAIREQCGYPADGGRAPQQQADRGGRQRWLR